MSTNELLTRRVAKILPSKEGLEKLVSEKKIKLYQGVDPTFNKLHLGHTIGFRKLMDFAKAGHDVTLLFGTGTVLVGDPSLRDTGRKLITPEEVEANIQDWKRQVSPIIDFDLIKVKQNGDWLTKLGLKDIIKIASNISSVQLFKRDSFTRRIAKGDTVWYHETMYPLLQGYDSVAMDVDLEIGGTDQEFNMLIGRELQRKMNNREKYVLTVPMILGTDGKTMSKSSGNCIWLTDSSTDMFAKLMAVKDELIPTYFELLTDVPMEEVNSLDTNDPIGNKKRLAYEITRQFHGQEAAASARIHFESVIQGGLAPENTPEVAVPTGSSLLETLKRADLGVSNSDIKRTIEQGGVELDGSKLTDPATSLQKSGMLKFGKRTFRKLTLK